ncbi:hypothetical protein HNY73_003941 [Argiope bruennichi]|uniref:Uncharacterized protein n=1 Tax=Argiope bruennichi TaxID=94029 RepID=A0A8T0FMP8_ARGBR|nr:hypothetical protein HNY73_003941 [Argiope bruennichi]
MVLLSTANVMIQNNVGMFMSARALLDVCSMSHFISKRLADKLNLKKEKRNIVRVARIKTPPSSLKTFVANRVTRIQEYTKNFQWYYVNIAENPADLISRGVFPSKIQQLDIWWNGPSFLSSSSWPNFNDDPGVADGEYLLEVKTTAKNSELNNDPMINLSICNNSSFLQCILDISNNYNKIVRVLSYVFRFVKNLKGAVKTTGPLNAEELNYAETFLNSRVC